MKVLLDAEAKKERQKAYRETAVGKKEREKEGAKQMLEEEGMPSNAIPANIPSSLKLTLGRGL